MPALSPTMTEGNIANWKVKEGDSFVVGDVILEIETDKASMDVEAQDDGVMAKIIQPNGTKSVQVGTRIAVVADEGDDLTSLEIPPEDSKTASKTEQQPSQTDSSTQQPQSNTSEPPVSASKPATPPPSSAGQSSKYPLYPSVAALLHEKHIPDSEIAKIPATGPSGRLLKGDVLAYLGSIESSYSSTQSKRIQKLSHLDLSNIKAAPPSAPTQPSTTATPPPPSPPPIPTTVSISLPISLTPILTLQKRLQDSLGTSIPLSTILARATDLANDDLPRTKASLDSPADLFNAIVGLEARNPLTSPGNYIPDILPSSSVGAPQPSTRGAAKAVRRPEPDIIDILSGKVNARSSAPKPAPPSPPPTSAQAPNVFSLTVPKGEEMRARTFLERMKTVLQVEPGRLVL